MTDIKVELTFTTANILTQDQAKLFWTTGEDFNRTGAKTYDWRVSLSAAGLAEAAAGAIAQVHLNLPDFTMDAVTIRSVRSSELGWDSALRAGARS